MGKYHNSSGIWDLKPYYLGPWSLRALGLGYRDCGLKLPRSRRRERLGGLRI